MIKARRETRRKRGKTREENLGTKRTHRTLKWNGMKKRKGINCNEASTVSTSQ